jgi:hypothetical protein
MRIEVTSEKVVENSGTSAKNGKPYTIRKQAAYAHIADADGVVCKQRLEIQLDRMDEPYKVGAYTLHDSSFMVGDFGSLRLGRVVLQPIKAS